MSKNGLRKITAQDLAKLLYSIIIGIIVTTLLFFLVQAFISNDRKKIYKNPCETICTITDVRNNKGNYVLFTYYVNGKIHKGRSPAPVGAEIDNRYILQYQCDDIKNYILLSDKLVLTKLEMLDTASCDLVGIVFDENSCEFSFTVDKIDTITKAQELNPVLLNSIDAKKVKVIYLKSNPHKAILQ